MWWWLLFVVLFLAAVAGSIYAGVSVVRRRQQQRQAGASHASPTTHDAARVTADRYRPPAAAAGDTDGGPPAYTDRRLIAAAVAPVERRAAMSVTMGDVWRHWDAACRAAGAEYFLAYSSLFLHGLKRDEDVPIDFFYVDVGMMAHQVTALRNALSTSDDANDGDYRVYFPDDDAESVEVVLRHEPTGMMVRAHAFYPEDAVGVPRATPPPPPHTTVRDDTHGSDEKLKGRKEEEEEPSMLATLDGRLYPRELVERLVEVEACGALVKAPADARKLYEIQGDDAVPVTLDQSQHPDQPFFLRPSPAAVTVASAAA